MFLYVRRNQFGFFRRGATDGLLWFIPLRCSAPCGACALHGRQVKSATWSSGGFTPPLRLSGTAVTGGLQMSVLERIDWRVSSLLYFPFYSWLSLTQPASRLSLLLQSPCLFYYFPPWSPVCNRAAPCALLNNPWLMSIRPSPLRQLRVIWFEATGWCCLQSKLK